MNEPVSGYLTSKVPYIQSWKKVWAIAVVLALVLLLVMTLLQPIGIYEYSSPNKYLIIAGFSLCIIIPMILFHPVEQAIYTYQNKNWFLYNEIGTVFTIWLVISFFSYIYNEFTLNYDPDSSLGITGFMDFSVPVLVPYSIFLIPLWVYLRYRLGQSSDMDQRSDQKVEVKGQNKDEHVKFSRSKFIYAEAQRNYVEIYYIRNGEVEKSMIRNTLKSAASQIPDAVRVHRSYLVHKRYISKIDGNVRNPYIKIEPFDIELPISSEFYKTHR